MVKLSFTCLGLLNSYLKLLYKMQIRSPVGVHCCPSRDDRFNRDILALSSRSSELPQTLEVSQAGSKSTFPNTKRSSTTSTLAGSWRERVRGLFEPALREAEDMMLSLPYADIRQKTSHLAKVLDDFASSGVERAEDKDLSGSRTAFKANLRDTQSCLMVLASAGSSTNCSASPAFPRHRCTPSKIMTTM